MVLASAPFVSVGALHCACRNAAATRRASPRSESLNCRCCWKPKPRALRSTDAQPIPQMQMCAPAAAGQSVEMAVMPVSLLPNEPPIQALAPAPMLPLAPRWERGTDAHGEIHFLDHSSGTTTWTDPLATAVSPAKLSRAQGEYAASLAELVSTPVRTSGVEPTRDAGFAACKHAVMQSTISYKPV